MREDEFKCAGCKEDCSDTDKTSGSLFKHNRNSEVPNRRNELPSKFYDLLTIDEFCNATVSYSSESQGNVRCDHEAGDATLPLKRLHSRTHFNQIKSGQLNQASDKVYESNRKKNKRKLDCEAIAEMNRHYDHNVCLDRFIYDMEQVQEEETEPEEVEEKDSQTIDACLAEPLDRSLSTPSAEANAPVHTINADNCSNCSNSMGGCSWCTTSGSSSLAPGSSGTESGGSHISSSVKSSNKNSEKNSEESNDYKKEAAAKNENAVEAVKQPEMILTTPQFQTTSFSSEKGSGGDSGVGTWSGGNKDAKMTNVCTNKNYKGGKLGRKRKREYIYNPKPLKEKKSKMTVPDQSKTQDYWEKRLRNNEAAKKSRELRRLKELETRLKFTQLRKENETLRKAIASLLKRNKTIDFILEEYEKSIKGDIFTSQQVVVSG